MWAFFIIEKTVMLNFFYDSLDVLKEVKKPTQGEVVRWTVATLTVMVIAWLFFMVVDFVFFQVYNKAIYSFLSSLF